VFPECHQLGEIIPQTETIRWDQLLDAGSEANTRSKGTLRREGKDYIVHDGGRDAHKTFG
jgi:ribosome-binding ATPase YchF (GTP1/OBG family)